MKYKVPFVNYSLQYLNIKKDLNQAIERVLLNGDLILRQDVEQFEKNIASFVGTKYAVGVNSCSDALIFSLMAAGIKPGDEVITVSHTFFATIEAIHHIGAVPILVDIGEDFLMDMSTLEKAITSKTKAVIPVHLNGRICDMEQLTAIAEKHNLIIIEDSAQALGATYKREKAGSFGVAGCFSFYPAKILGAFGDAGAITTNDGNLAEEIRLLRNHGQRTKTELICYGFTSRLDNLQAAILNTKMKYLPEWIERRREIANLYQKGLSEVKNIKLPPAVKNSPERFDIYQNYVLRAEKRDELFHFLKEEGIETLIKDPIPNHRHINLGLSHFSLPLTEKFANEVISLPMYPELENTQIDYAINCIKNFYKN